MTFGFLSFEPDEVRGEHSTPMGAERLMRAQSCPAKALKAEIVYGGDIPPIGTDQ